MLLAGNPFAPDTVSAWWSFAVSAVAAVGTLAAVAFSVVLAGRDYRDRVRRQAGGVNVWMAHNDPRVDRDSASWSEYVISNQSTAPITQVVLEVDIAWTWHDDERAIRKELGKLPKTYVVQVPPGDWLVDGPESPGSAMDLRPGTRVSFVDSIGRSWMRDGRGALVAIREQPFASMPRGEKASPGPITRLG